jgi:peptide/nickel transport system substrate-binding protein
MESAEEMMQMEAPMLAEMVAAGTLPPLDERLPANPLVWDFPDVNAFEKETGQYGGTIRLGHINDLNGFATIGLARIASDRSTYYPDIAQSWEWADDFTSITFHLRPGMKWSDGAPFTAHDIVFWYDEIIRSDVREAPLGVGGMNSVADTITAVDDFTLHFDFAQPSPLFLFGSRGFGGGEPSTWERSAAHYMKQFHPKFNPESGVDAQEQFQSMFDAMRQPRYIEDPNRPVLWGWKPLEYKEGQLARLERNPYFWAVDKMGRQLPYIDYVENFLLGDADAEVIKLKLIAGETNFERRRTSVADVPLLRENEDSAGIDIIYTRKPEGSQQGIIINPHHMDSQMREFLGAADFRRALSLAIDRAAINETAYFGLGQPGHGFSDPGVYNEAVDGAWAEFDLEQASELLDGLGLTERDSEGYRTLPDGSALTFTIMYTSGWHPGADETGEISAEGWKAIGLRGIAQSVEHRLRNERIASNDWEAWVNPWVGGVWDQDLRYGTGACRTGPIYCQWWRSRHLDEADRPGEEPTGKFREMFELEEVILTTVDPVERQEALDQRRALLADQLFNIGIVQGLPHVVVASKNLRGVWGRTDEMAYSLGAGDEDYWPRSWFFADE